MQISIECWPVSLAVSRNVLREYEVVEALTCLLNSLDLSTPPIDDRLRCVVELIQLIHGKRVHEYLGHLCACTDKLQDMSVVSGFPSGVCLISGPSLSSSDRVLQCRYKLFDLVVVENSGWYAAFRSKSFEQVRPLRPFTICSRPDTRFVSLEWYWELVLRHKVKSALGENVIGTTYHLVLFVDVEVYG